MVNLLIQLIQILLPAYISNAAPTFLIKYKKHPIDFYKKINGKRILGDGKTIEGLIFSMFIGFLTGLIINYFLGTFSIPALPITPFMSSIIALGAMLGDSVGSYMKRRKNMKRGENAGLLDMIDFMIGALIITRLMLSYHWLVALIGLIFTPAIHRLANIIGYQIGVKKEPW